MRLQTKPARAVLHRPGAPARGADHAFTKILVAPALPLTQFTTQFLEFNGQGVVHRKAREADRVRRERTRRRGLRRGKEGRGGGADRAGTLEPLAQAEPRKRFLAPTADEFTANPVTRIMSGFPYCHRHTAPA